ncbi:carbohydrate sulfotransferase 1 [Patella vulgata]|uniref:carbohydrate sulfotransferase 1 n=1 Tax=Patella vulgata TaxID=6465 RepID=UPI00217FCFC2|nr:carbohydrate sulfotransferase 1 [Patella vulgata]
MRSKVFFTHICFRRGISVKKFIYLVLSVSALILFIYSYNHSELISSDRPTSGSGSKLWQPTGNVGTQIGETYTKEDRKKVILVAYPRSGSTFTADVIRANSDVLFIFEPLFTSLKKHIGKPFLVTEKKVYKRTKTNMTTFEEEVKKVMKAFLNCDSSLADLPLRVLQNEVLEIREDTFPLFDCARNITKYNQTLMSHCAEKYIKLCEQRKVILAKVIRYPSEILYNQMKNDPNLYVVYLVRDPRGIMSSQMTNFQNFEWETIRRASKEFCTLMEKDIQVMEDLHDLYPDRVKFIRYESLATNPLGDARDIYNFLKLDLTKNAINVIKLQTASNRTSCDVGCTLRRNSKNVPYQWRIRANFTYIQNIDRVCGNLYAKMCYVPVKSSNHLKNMSISLIKPCVKYGVNM